jgi:DnaK suppressor protein
MSDTNNLSTNKGDEGAELRIGVVQPATKNIPAMRLNANDAEILATAKERYSNKDLEMFRKLIHEQRQEASEEFDILSEQMLDTSGEFDSDNQSFSLHTAEQGTDAMEREKTFLHAQRTSDYIKKLDEAIARIDRGTYGICVVCGKLIEKQRLGAVPITQKHVDCKNKTQQKKLTSDQTYRDIPDTESVD